MRFVKYRKGMAGVLRGDHIAQALGVPCETAYTTPDEWVVFVKTLDGIKQAKADGCMIALDPVDAFCYPGYEPTGCPLPEVDLLIVPNRACMSSYLQMFPRAEFMVVPHQWDARISGECEQDEFRPGYIGAKFNLLENLAVPVVVDGQIKAMSRFNCHIGGAITQEGRRRKPATKVAAAAAVGAVIVTGADASAVELLGNEYPFFAENTLFNGLFKARKAFGGSAWQEAREIMRGVKETTSLAAVVEKYKILMGNQSND